MTEQPGLSDAEAAYAYAYRDHLVTGQVEPDDLNLDPVRAEAIRDAILAAQRRAFMAPFRRARKARREGNAT